MKQGVNPYRYDNLDNLMQRPKEKVTKNLTNALCEGD